MSGEAGGNARDEIGLDGRSNGIESDELAAGNSARLEMGVAALEDHGRGIDVVIMGTALPFFEFTTALRKFDLAGEVRRTGEGSRQGC